MGISKQSVITALQAPEPGRVPVILAGAAFGRHGWRNVNAVEAGYAEFVNSSGR